MTMGNNELNNRIIKNVRNRIVVSNLESEEKMRIERKKQVISLTMVVVLFLTGGFMTVNATTDGQLTENIKNTIKVIFVKDSTEQEIEGKSYTDSKGDTWIKYEKNTEDSETKTDINKSTLEGENLQLDEKISEDEIELTINNKQ